MKVWLPFFLMLFFSSSWAQLPLSAEAQLESLKKISFPLYQKRVSDIKQSNSLGDERACIGFNVSPNKSGELGYYITAGHCMNAYFVRAKNGQEFDSPALAFSTGGAYDYLYSFQVLCEKEKIHFPKFAIPKVGDTYYTLGQIRPEETIARPELSKLAGNEFEKLGLVVMTLMSIDEIAGLSFSQVCPNSGCTYRATPGISGAPIVDKSGRVVAIFKGYAELTPSKPLGVKLDYVLPLIVSAANNDNTFNRAKYCTSPK